MQSFISLGHLLAYLEFVSKLMCRVNSEQIQQNTSWMIQLPSADSGCWINISGLTEENCSVGKPTDNLKEFKAN